MEKKTCQSENLIFGKKNCVFYTALLITWAISDFDQTGGIRKFIELTRMREVCILPRKTQKYCYELKKIQYKKSSKSNFTKKKYQFFFMIQGKSSSKKLMKEKQFERIFIKNSSSNIFFLFYRGVQPQVSPMVYNPPTLTFTMI